MTDATAAPKYLTTGEAARRLQVHRGTAWRWARAGLIPCERLPGRERPRLRFRRDDVERAAALIEDPDEKEF